jgi:hypothetical protein
VKFYITCEVEDPESDGADRLLPFIARANWRDVWARDTDPKRAMANVKGIILAALVEFPDPPDEIRFSCLDLTTHRKSTPP